MVEVLWVVANSIQRAVQKPYEMIQWMDKIHFAPPKKPWNGLILLYIPQQIMVSPMVS